MVCPACSHRDDSLIQPDCPACWGAGTIALGRPTLRHYPSEVAALALTKVLDRAIEELAARRFPTHAARWMAQRVGIATAVEQVRRIGIVGDPPPGTVSPIPAGVTLDVLGRWRPEDDHLISGGGELAGAPLNVGMLGGDGARLAAVCAQRWTDNRQPTTASRQPPADLPPDAFRAWLEHGRKPDPTRDWLDGRDVARLMGWRPEIMRRHRDEGLLPEPDAWTGPSGLRALWRPETIATWRANLPSNANGKDPGRVRAEAERRRSGRRRR